MNKKKIIFIAIILILAILTVFFILNLNQKTQTCKVIWSNSFGETESEEGWYVKSTDDGGCIILGVKTYNNSYETENQDISLIKINENGDKQWYEKFGGEGHEYGKAIIEADNGYIIAGNSNSEVITESDYNNAWLIKTDFNGNKIWNKTYDNMYPDGVNSIIETKDKNYVLTGFKYSYINKDEDLWIFKIDDSGEIIWSITHGGAGFEEGRSLIETDDGYVVAGRTSSDALLLKVDKEGGKIWNKTFDGYNNKDLFNQIIQSNDIYIMVGNTQNKTKYDEYYSNGYIVITDKNGNILSERIMEERKETGISSVEKTSDGYIITGYIGAYGTGEGDIIVEKIDKSVNRVWIKTYGGKYDDASIWIDKGEKNNYFLTGYTDKNGDGYKKIWVSKIKIIE